MSEAGYALFAERTSAPMVVTEVCTAAAAATGCVRKLVSGMLDVVVEVIDMSARAHA
jgi:hypothetical protein